MSFDVNSIAILNIHGVDYRGIVFGKNLIFSHNKNTYYERNEEKSKEYARNRYHLKNGKVK